MLNMYISFHTITFKWTTLFSCARRKNLLPKEWIHSYKKISMCILIDAYVELSHNSVCKRNSFRHYSIFSCMKTRKATVLVGRGDGGGNTNLKRWKYKKRDWWDDDDDDTDDNTYLYVCIVCEFMHVCIIWNGKDLSSSFLLPFI